MRTRVVSAMLVMLLFGPLSTDRSLRASVAGSASVSVEYIADLRAPDGAEAYRFNIAIEPVMFRLQSVQGKYRLLRLRVLNATPTPLAFSADRDRLEVLTRDGATIAAVLNPQRGDAAFWDALDATTRETLAYPISLKGTPASSPGARPSSPESMYIYVLVPAAPVSQLPESFRYTVASLNQTIVIRTRPATAA